ncbi:MAG: NUDIX domain-containing protein [Candidatus ainarchaeum sp.]|nr:NUDIX domain-containing protein [Candidatus ainarchaeum sp.]
MITVAKAVISDSNKVLLVKRSAKAKFFPGLWDFPGGKQELGETSDQSVVREAKEETNLAVVPEDKFSEFDYTEKGEKIHFFVFKIKNYSGKVKLSHEHTDFNWIDLKDLDKFEIAPVVKMFFKLKN